MKKIKLFFITMMMSLVVAACSGDSSPEDAAKNLIKALGTGESSQVLETIYIDEADNTPEIKQMIEGKLGMLATGAKQEMDAKGGVKSIATSNVVYNDDKTAATVDVTVTYGNGEVDGPDEMDLIKTKDGWKAKL